MHRRRLRDRRAINIRIGKATNKDRRCFACPPDMMLRATTLYHELVRDDGDSGGSGASP